MVGDLWLQGKRLFPTVGISIEAQERPSSQIVLRPTVLVFGFAVALACAGAVLYLAIHSVLDERMATAARAAEMRMERANVDLQDAMAALQDRLGAATRARAQSQSRLAALASRSGTLRGLLYTAEEKLDAAAETRSRLSQQTGAMQQQLAATERVAFSKADRIAQLTRALTEAHKELYEEKAQRATLAARLSKAEGDALEQQRLRARVNALERQLSLRTRARPRHQFAAAAPVDRAAAAVARTAAYEPAGHGVAALDDSGFGEFERVLASTGLDVARLLSKFGARSGEGGPFVPPPKGGKPPGQLSAQKLLALRRLVKSLPIGSPMANYRLTSPFGMRKDPFNGRPAFHPGVDLAAPFGTPIYATAPGVVTYAGWMEGYGKLIIIDHGHGITTRYGHLTRFTVVVGEHVAAGTQIGDEGSTGRSTGPHVIYEVRVNGVPQNPEKFMDLAEVIPVAAR